jgi:hypothetical protein
LVEEGRDRCVCADIGRQVRISGKVRPHAGALQPTPKNGLKAALRDPGRRGHRPMLNKCTVTAQPASRPVGDDAPLCPQSAIH